VPSRQLSRRGCSSPANAFCWYCRPIYVPWNACSIEFHVYPLHVNGNEQAATAISLAQAIDHPLLQRRQAPDDVDECCADFVTRCVGAFRNGTVKGNRAVRLRPFEAKEMWTNEAATASALRAFQHDEAHRFPPARDLSWGRISCRLRYGCRLRSGCSGKNRRVEWSEVAT